MKKQVKIIGLVIGIFIILAQCSLNSYLLLSYYAHDKLIKDLREENDFYDDILNAFNRKMIDCTKDSNCSNEGEICAGFAGISCCEGLTCWTESEENYPDQSGICIKD